MSQSAWQKLFRVLEQRGVDYISLHRVMTSFFGSRNCGADAEALADVTLLDRLARKVDEGKEVRSFISYSKRIGNNVYKEYCKDREKFRNMARDLLYLKPDIYKLDEDIDLRRKCQEDCVSKLAEPDRQLMVDYYVIGRDRSELAEELGVVLATLRLRVHRLKVRLAKCVDACRRSA